MADIDPTVRGEHLGDELRRLREEAKFTLTKASKKIDVSAATLSKIESGLRTAKLEYVAGLLAIYDVVGETRETVLAVAREAPQPGWILRASLAEQYGTLRQLEKRATKIVSCESLLIPGLLQTTEYILAVMTEIGGWDDATAGDRLAGRIRHQAVLRFPAPEFVAIIGEQALRNQVGGPEVLRAQLKYLLEAGGRPKISIRVVPMRHRGNPAMAGPYLRLHIPGRAGVVY
ncbi:MAG TPA: helix-turn-helix transcriptional regulator, partial [Pseudonocardiaceae bacterium]|nr:helix-turn-helix transcriptional regulator [Pseudonocardiaceae bacterium]